MIMEISSDICCVEREGDVVMQLDGEVDDTIEHIAKGAVHSSGGLNHPAKLGHVGRHPIGVEVGCAARHPDSRQRVRWQPPINEGALSRSPGDPHLQLGACSRAGPLSMEPNTEKLG